MKTGVPKMGLGYKWSNRFLKLATEVGSWSKDPSRQVGAVIVRPNRTIVSVGYNGFARGVDDHEDRYTDRIIKLEMVVHAEINAILSAKENLEGYTIFSTLLPCSRCAAIIINSGISKVVTYAIPEKPEDKDKVLLFDQSLQQFAEAQLEVVQIENTTMH
jgi:dCMP deaminase